MSAQSLGINVMPVADSLVNNMVTENTAPIKREGIPDVLKGALIGSGASAGMLGALHLIASHIKGSSSAIKKLLAPAIITSGAIGAITPTLVNLSIARRRGVIDDARADVLRARLISNGTLSHDSINNAYNIDQELLKTSGIMSGTLIGSVYGVAKGTAGVAGKVFDVGAKGVGSSAKYLALSKKPGAPQVVQRLARYGTVGGGMAGVGAISKRMARPISGSNYTTFLRNNIMSGRINPNNVGVKDLDSVKKLGLR